MKTTFYSIITIVLISFSSCKKTITEEMTVNKNCTGTYLITPNEKLFRVCNTDLFLEYKTNEKVSVDYYTIDHDAYCEQEGAICLMNYPYDETIEVSKIN